MQQYIDGKVLNYIFTVGYRNLKRRMDVINDLNVFPVPDGDTGTNMVHTFGGGLGAVTVQSNVSDYMKDLSKAVLLSARGNSGVIFSQFFRGLYRGFENKESVCFDDLAYAFACAKEDSYKSIMTPAEGTILTIIREAAEFLDKNSSKYADFKSGFEALISCMSDTLSRTPEMLPVLKEAGVVDSGGAGLVCFFEGMHTYFCGTTLDDIEDNDSFTPKTVNAGSFGPDSVMEYGYCTEFILQLMNAKTDISTFSTDEFVKPLNALGDSIVAVASDGIVKIHIHTFEPEKVLAYARRFGEFVTLKIENMSVQHNEIQAESVSPATPKKEKVKYAVITVASGDGIVDYFQNIGASAVIDGGQTNNPSVSEFLAAFDRFEAEHIVVLPNNSNIILTANQAAEMYENCKVHVIPTKSITEGYSALSMMNLWVDTVEELIEDMSAGLSSVTSAYVTTATRTTNIGGIDIVKDNYIGIKDKDIRLCSPDRFATVCGIIKSVMDESEKAVIIIFCGKSVPPEETEALSNFMKTEYPLIDVGFVDGKQDVYDYIISLE